MNKKKKKVSFKKWIGRLHLWLGLLSGIVVFIVAITGCIYVFHDEIKDITRDHRLVEAQNSEYVLPSSFITSAEALYPDFKTDFVMYQGRNRSAFVYGELEKEPFYFYFDPYTGEYLAKENLHEDFFHIVEELHMYLLLPEEFGKQVVGISTIIFVFMLISGIILWWPKKRKHLKKKLQVKWNAKWRRINYDLHSSIGLYISSIALILALTGLTFVYSWMQDVIYETVNLGEEYHSDRIEQDIKQTSAKTSKGNVLDIAFIKTTEKFPDQEMYFVWKQNDSIPIISGAYPEALNYHGQSNLYFHPETGELIATQNYADKSAGLQFQELNYGIHTGQYFGLLGKILAFFASLFVAVLPVSGFLIWCGRKRKSRK